MAPAKNRRTVPTKDNMPIIIGIDEAGYGPTLGPLVITATAFDVAGVGGTSSPDLWRVLSEAVTRPHDTNGRSDPRILVGDSKKLYSAKKGLRRLEEGVLAFHMCFSENVSDIKDLLIPLGCYDQQRLKLYPWYHNKKLGLPLASNTADLTHKHNKLKDILSSNEVRYLGARSVVISPHQFNREVERLDNKSLLLFENCVNLIAGLCREYGDAEVFCDKHGGRDRYGPMLARAFRGSSVKKLSEEGKISSRYELRHGSGRVRISFQMNAEEKHMPVALSSMYSKYIRELHLGLFNGFWREHLPGLRPTAGYPEDARRFLGDINDLRKSLDIKDEILIRDR